MLDKLIGSDLQSLLDSIGAPIYMMEVRPDGGFGYLCINAQLGELLGASTQGIVGRRPEEVFPAEQAARANARYALCVRSRGSVEGEEFVRLPTSERWWRMALRPVFDDGGQVVRILGTASDVTEQKEAQEALRYQHLLLSVQQELTPDGIMVAEVSGRALSWNTRFKEIWGFSDEQLRQGRNVALPLALAQLVDPDPFQAQMKRLYLDLHEAVDAAELAFKDGRTLVWHSRGLIDEGGVGRGRVWYFRDITMRKQAEEALRAEHRRKDEFLATLAHELRNPLAPLRTGLQILRLSPAGGPAAAKALETMDRQFSHVVRLVDDLLDISRITHDRMELRRERLALRPFLDSAIEACRPFIDAGRHELALHLPDEPLHLEADPIRLTQVIGNLLHNAAKYSLDGGRIELSARREGGEAVIRVADCGVGIPQPMLSKVFEMFTQVSNTLDRAQGGLGIGLTITKRLVEMHGGRIEAGRRHPDPGTVFTVRLPLAQDHARKDQGTEERRLQGQPRRVLVVDDNIDAAATFAMMLEMLGHETCTAHSGPEALGTARTFRPSIVFCDIGMPGMNGHEVARRFREEPVLAPTVLVALTGWGSDSDKRQAKAAGFDLHLTKPVDAAAVQDALAWSPPRRTAKIAS